MKRPSEKEITLMVLGEATTRRASEIRRMSADDPELAMEIAYQESIARALVGPTTGLEDLDLVAGVRARLDEPAPVRSRLGVRIVVAAVACAAALISAVIWRGGPDQPEFVAKGSGVDDPSRWAGVELYRAKDSERVAGVIGAREAILVAYRNAGPRPYRSLMVFLVDAAGNCHWIYPAYVEAGSNPRSVPIEDASTLVELPDSVTHSLQPGKVAMYALFSHVPHSVLEVEEALRHALTPAGFNTASPPGLGLDDTAEERRTLVVIP